MMSMPALGFSQSTTEQGFHEYIFEKGDTLSEVVFQRIGRGYRLYGPKGWLEKNKQINPQVKDWRRILPSTKIRLLLPKSDEGELVEGKSEPEIDSPATESSKTEQPKSVQPAERQSEPADEPKRKSWDAVSLVASGYLGLRFGIPILRSELMEKTRFYSLFFEGKRSFISGMRVYWDYVPDVKATTNDLDLKFGWSRTLIGYAWKLGLFKNLNIFVTPKLGRYSLNLTAPRENSAGEIVADDVSVPSAASLGYQIDVEWHLPPFLNRLWVGQDFSSDLLSTSAFIQSDRVGFDVFYHLKDLHELPLSPALIFFCFLERIQVMGKDAIEGEDRDLKISFSSSYLGTGITLSW